MASAGSRALLLVLSIPLLQPALAIKCYTCNSKQDSKCKDPFQDTGLVPVDCSQDQQQRQHTRQAIEEVLTLMTKLGQIPGPVSEQPVTPSINDSIPMACQKMEIEVVGERVTGRGCSSQPVGFYHPCDSLKIITNEQIVLHYCSLCDEDGCNGSWRPRWEPWVALLLLLPALLK